MTGPIAAEVAGEPVRVAEVDGREASLRAAPGAAALPARGTSEGRQLRRWLTQLLVAERVVTIEADRRGLTERDAPGPLEVLPDATARVEIGSLAAALLDSMPLARALFVDLTAEVGVSEEEIGDYYARNGHCFAEPVRRDAAGWRVFDHDPRTDREPAADPQGRSLPAHRAQGGLMPGDHQGGFMPGDRPRGGVMPLSRVRPLIEVELRGAASRQTFARWLDAARADLVRLRPGFEHPGDPGQPDNTHRH